MHEQIARTLYYLQIHLLFASLVWCAAWCLTSRRSGNAALNYWIWVATLLNFLFPIGAVIDRLGRAHLDWASPLGVVGDLANEISRPGVLSTTVGLVWLLGCAAMFVRLCRRLRLDRLEFDRTATHMQDPREFRLQGISIKFSGEDQSPVVDGLLRPRILLPNGIDQILSKHELRAVLLHELTHAKRRDNLIRLVQELALCLLWFHPFLWLTRSRLALYRELSCDDSVIRGAAGKDLISALAKLANPERELLIQASASSFLSERLARLAGRAQDIQRPASALLGAVFVAVLGCGILETVAHTACCFIAKH